MEQTSNGAVDWIEGDGDNDNDEPIRITDQPIMEQRIMENNSRRFRLTESTPPMQEPLVSQLGYLGNTEAASQILNGTFVCPPELETETQLFISALRVTSLAMMANKVSTSVTKEDFKSYSKHTRERISNIHFGHYKASAESDYVSEIHALFTKIVVSTGYSPTRWQNCLSVMLEKSPGDRRPDKLQAIVLMEADFNFANKLFLGKQMMDSAETQDTIPEEIFARRGHQAIEVGICRDLTFDIMLQKRLQDPMLLWMRVTVMIDSLTTWHQSCASIMVWQLKLSPVYSSQSK
jgi:hypothetical protein